MIRFTKNGLEKLKKDLENLTKERPAAVLDLKKARDMGDLSENGYYKSTKSRLSSIDYNLRKLSYELKNAAVVQHGNKGYADIGSTVILKNQDGEVTYFLVGDLEAEPSKHKISLFSPIGKSILGKRAGYKIIIEIPKGKINYTIEKIL